MGLHQIKKSNETVTRIKRQPTNWKKIITSYSTGKELISRMYKELKKKNQQQKNK
jgi:hypothetical protein